MESVCKEEKVPATILAIGTANPKSCYYQEDYPDFYFKVTKSEDNIALKNKFKDICEKSGIKKRYLAITEEILKANPAISTLNATSLNARQDILIHEVPKLGKEAALKAIKEWGQPISRITHLIFCTTSCIDSPGPDFQLINLLGLNPSVNRIMIFQQGCFGGAKALRIAKDLTENNVYARVLVVCCEITTMFFQQPSETNPSILVGSSLFSDGASAVIVGANPDPKTERQLFNLISAKQTLIPNSEKAITLHLREVGAEYFLSSEIPYLVSGKIEECLNKGFEVINGFNGDWNSLFYIVHPGGPRILDKIEEEIGLKKEKLRATRHVLSEFGNMGCPSVLFILDEMRNKSIEEGKSTTGDGLEWGVLFGIGPGITVETIVLRSVATTH